MPQSILVPLDGSPLAGLAVPEALALGKLADSRVTLLRVVPPIQDIIHDGETFSVDQQWERSKAAALNYLKSICDQPEWKKIAVQVAVEMGEPAEVIIDFAEKHKIDRIVLSTHGRTGLNRWVSGSVAEKVLRAAGRTIVLVRPPSELRRARAVLREEPRPPEGACSNALAEIRSRIQSDPDHCFPR